MNSPDRIEISELEVFFHVGVPDEERQKPQRLLIDIEMEHDFALAISGDDVTCTIDYDAVCRSITALGEGRSWKLIEKLAEDVAQTILSRFQPQKVRVRILKFILPQTRHVAVSIERQREEP